MSSVRWFSVDVSLIPLTMRVKPDDRRTLVEVRAQMGKETEERITNKPDKTYEIDGVLILDFSEAFQRLNKMLIRWARFEKFSWCVFLGGSGAGLYGTWSLISAGTPLAQFAAKVTAVVTPALLVVVFMSAYLTRKGIKKIKTALGGFDDRCMNSASSAAEIRKGVLDNPIRSDKAQTIKLGHSVRWPPQDLLTDNEKQKSGIFNAVRTYPDIQN